MNLIRNEYVVKFLEVKIQLEENKFVSMMEIIDSNNQREDVVRKLEDVRMTEPTQINPTTGLRRDAKLKVHVVDA